MLENPEQLEQELKAVRELAGLVELALQQARRLACVGGAVHGFQRAARGRKEGGRGRIGAGQVFQPFSDGVLKHTGSERFCSY